MTLISIRERGTLHAGPVVSIDGQEYPIHGRPTRSTRKEERRAGVVLRGAPALPVHGPGAGAAGRGQHHRLRRAPLRPGLSPTPRPTPSYRAATQGNLAELTVEIAGSPAFQQLHWEALKDPKLAQPLALQATFVRRNLTPQPIKARLREAPTVNVLLVTARPGGARDVGYRTIARPLVETLRQAKLRVQVEILRPGTYEALVRHLEAVQERHGPGYYHVIHFDVHGGLLDLRPVRPAGAGAGRASASPTRCAATAGRACRPTTGVKAFLFLEHGQAGQADPVEATRAGRAAAGARHPHRHAQRLPERQAGGRPARPAWAASSCRPACRWCWPWATR